MHHILYIAHERKMGGANLCLYELAEAMKKRGHEVTVVVLFHGCQIDVELRKIGIKTIACPFGWWQVPKDWNLFYKFIFVLMNLAQKFFAIRICHYVKKHGVDIIHSNSSVIDIGMYIAKKTGVKHIWHFREFELVGYGLTYLFGRHKSMKCVNQSDKVLFISHALRDSYPDIREEISEVLYDGVSEKYIMNEKVHNTSLVFVVAGNLCANKNQMLVLQAVKRLYEKRITDFKVKIAGDCMDVQSSVQYKKELLDYIERNALKNVEMLGRVTDMNGLRRNADIEIVAAKGEAFGRVTVEGMLARNPVIVAASGASPELVADGIAGFIFESDNVEELAEKMEYMICHPEEVVTMGNAAFDSVKDRFILKNNVDNIEKVYEELNK